MTESIYTVYKTTNNINNKIYIGQHKTKNINDSYLGTGDHIKRALKKHGKENFSKEILFEYDNPEEMNAKEIELVTEDFVKRSDNYNIAVGGYNTFGYTNKGFAVVKDSTGKTSRVSVEDPDYKSGKLVSITKGTGNYRNIKTGKIEKLPIDDIRIGSLYDGTQKGFGAYKSAKTGKFLSLRETDKRVISGEYIAVCKGMVAVVDKNGKSFQVSKEDPRWISGELIHPNKGKIASAETKAKMSAIRTGKKTYKPEGIYITPFGNFNYAKDASDHIKTLLPESIRKICKNPDKIISKASALRSRFITMDMVGKTYKEVGFNFITKGVTKNDR